MTPVHVRTLVYSTESLALKVKGSLRYHDGDGHENFA